MLLPTTDGCRQTEIEEIIEDEIDAVWQQTKILQEFHMPFRTYYKGKKNIAYRLRNVEVYEQPKLSNME